MLNIMYELPEQADKGTYEITEDIVEGNSPATLFSARKAHKESA